MAFSDFKAIPEVQERFGIRHVENDFIESKNNAGPSEQFLREFDFNRDYIDVLTSEGARCEAIIFPVLREVYKEYADYYALWIKKPIAYDDVLSGTLDYFI